MIDVNEYTGELPESARTDVIALGSYIQAVVDRRFNELVAADDADWQKCFREIGDAAYGRFNALVFKPVREAMAFAGLKPVPQFPGSFQSSREWGNADESHQQRWFLTCIKAAGGSPLGTIAIGSHHDHTRFRLPRSPEVIAVSAVRRREVIELLTELMPEFGEAPEFREWYAQYLAVGQ